MAQDHQNEWFDNTVKLSDIEDRLILITGDEAYKIAIGLLNDISLVQSLFTIDEYPDLFMRSNVLTLEILQNLKDSSNDERTLKLLWVKFHEVLNSVLENAPYLIDVSFEDEKKAYKVFEYVLSFNCKAGRIFNLFGSQKILLGLIPLAIADKFDSNFMTAKDVINLSIALGSLSIDLRNKYTDILRREWTRELDNEQIDSLKIDLPIVSKSLTKLVNSLGKPEIIVELQEQNEENNRVIELILRNINYSLSFIHNGIQRLFIQNAAQYSIEILMDLKEQKNKNIHRLTELQNDLTEVPLFPTDLEESQRYRGYINDAFEGMRQYLD